MDNPFNSINIFLKYQNKIKKVNWRKNLSPEDFAYLIKSIYGLQGKILGFKDEEGTVYELSYLLKRKENFSHIPYEIIVKPDYSKTKTYLDLSELKSIKNFEEILSKSPKESMKILALFNETDKLFDDCLDSMQNIARDYHKDDCQFYWLLLSIADKSAYKKIFSFQPPVLAFYSAREKFMEMPLNELTLMNFPKLFNRLHQEHQTSVYTIDQSERSTASINSFYILDGGNSQRDAENDDVSQDTYVLDSKSVSTYELNSARSEDERISTEVFDIEEKNMRLFEDNFLEDKQKIEYSENRQNLFGKSLNHEEKKLDFKKKQENNEFKGSYFLKPLSKTNKNIEKNEKVVIETPPPIITKEEEKQNYENADEDNDIGSLSPSKYTDFYSLLHDNVTKFEPEDYGMAMCLYKEKDKDLFDLLNDCRKLNDKDLNSFLVSTFARKKFSLWLIDNFSHENIEIISEEKNIKNSGVYTAYQCFKYDNDLEDLKQMLDKALHKDNNVKNFRKPTDSIVEGDYHDFAKTPTDSDLMKKYVNQELHIIKEGSAKDEESPGIPADFNFDSLTKNKENKKYKDMIIAMKDQVEEKNEENFGFSLVLIGNERNSVNNEKSAKKKNDLTIECTKDEHPLAREVLEKFFDQGELEKNIETFHKLKMKVKLNFEEKEHMQHLFDQRDPSILHIVNKYKSDENLLSSLEKELKEITSASNIAISSSPRSIKKIQVFNLFKTCLEEFYNDHLINSTQVKLCLFLFMKIDMSILSAFEVFQLTKDKDDFLDSLNLIYKINYIKFEQQLDDIEEYDNITETQLKIVYAFQADLELSERTTLENIIKLQDHSLLKLHEEYQKTKNKKSFIRKVKELCNAKNRELKEHMPTSKEQSESAREEQKNRRRNLIETCKIHRFLKEIPNTTMLLEAIDKDEPQMESICSVYELTFDKQDFTENVKLYYKIRTNERIISLVTQVKEEKHWTELDFKIICDAIAEGNKLIKAAFQIFDESKDDYDREEFIDTLEKYINIQKSK